MTDLSRPTLESDLLHYQEAGDFAAQAETLMALAKLAEEDEAYRLAQGLYGQAWMIYEQIGQKRGIARILMAFIPILPNVFWDEQSGLDESWIDLAYLYDMALALYIELGDQREIANTYAAMGYLQLRPPDVVTDFLPRALDLYGMLNDVPGQLYVLQSLVYRYDPDDPLYWQCVDQALKLYRSLDDTSGELKFLGIVYQYRFESAEVQPYIERAFDLYRQLGNIRGEASLYMDISYANRESQNYEAARSALEAACRLYMQIEAYDQVLGVRYHIASVIAVTNGYEAYLRYHHDTMKLFPTIQTHKYHHFRQLSKLAREHNDFVTARYTLQQEIAMLWNNPEQQAKNYWEWGCIEAYEMGHIHMGYMLCHWAVTLFDRCFPGQKRYHRKLRHMRRDMNPSQYQYRPKSR